ncbi:MAG: hypothetical protein ACYCS0_01130 [bacterium]
MKKIKFTFQGNIIDVDESNLKKFLQNISNPLKRHKPEIDYIINHWDEIIAKKDEYFMFKNENDYYKVKELSFFYNKNLKNFMIKNNIWISIKIPNLAEENIVKFKKRSKKYSEYRYDVDNGWKGVLAQDLITEYFKSQIYKKKIDLELEEYTSEKEGVDDFDILLNKFKIDIKCATQPNYVEMTPKVNVEESKPKDFYIASKIFDDDELVIIGYFEHIDIGNYPFKFLYGTPYWGVKLYNAKPINMLLKTITGNLHE